MSPKYAKNDHIIEFLRGSQNLRSLYLGYHLSGLDRGKKSIVSQSFGKKNKTSQKMSCCDLVFLRELTPSTVRRQFRCWLSSQSHQNTIKQSGIAERRDIANPMWCVYIYILHIHTYVKLRTTIDSAYIYL